MSIHAGAQGGVAVGSGDTATRIAVFSASGQVSGFADLTRNANGQVHVGTGTVDGGISGESTLVVGRNIESTYSIIEAYNDQAVRWAEFRAYNANSGVQLSAKALGGTSGTSVGGSTDDNCAHIIHVGRLKVASTGAYAQEFITNNTKRFEVSNDGRLIATARLQGAKGADIASATTLTFGFDGNAFAITGTTTINHITTTGWQAGSVIRLLFGTSLTVTHNAGAPPANTAPILLSGAANLSATANDSLTLVYDGTSWRECARTVI